MSRWDAETIDAAKKLCLGGPKREIAAQWDGSLDMWMNAVRSGSLEGQCVLDVGCGVGRLMKPIAEEAKYVVGVDTSESMAQHARHYLKGVQNVAIFHADGPNWPMKDESIDFAYCVLCLQHQKSVLDIKQLFKEVYRVLKPQGRFRIQHKEAGEHIRVPVDQLVKILDNENMICVSDKFPLLNSKWRWLSAVK